MGSPELNGSNQSGPPALSPNWISVTNTEGAEDDGNGVEDGNSISSPASKKSDTSNSAVVSLAWMVQVKHATSKAKKKRWRAREVGMMTAACARATHNTTLRLLGNALALAFLRSTLGGPLRFFCREAFEAREHARGTKNGNRFP